MFPPGRENERLRITRICQAELPPTVDLLCQSWWHGHFSGHLHHTGYLPGPLFHLMCCGAKGTLYSQNPHPIFLLEILPLENEQFGTTDSTEIEDLQNDPV